MNPQSGIAPQFPQRARERAYTQQGGGARVTSIEGQRELSIAVQTQLRIVASQLAPEAALQFIVQQTKDATGASGAAFGMLQGEELVYRAATGSASAILGTRRNAKTSLAAGCISDAVTVQKGDVSSVPTGATSAEIAAGSYVAVPVFHRHHPAGALEIFSEKEQAFDDQALRALQLMAGLVTEALSAEDEEQSKRELARERQAILDAVKQATPVEVQSICERAVTNAGSSPVCETLIGELDARQKTDALRGASFSKPGAPAPTQAAREGGDRAEETASVAQKAAGQVGDSTSVGVTVSKTGSSGAGVTPSVEHPSSATKGPSIGEFVQTGGRAAMGGLGNLLREGQASLRQMVKDIRAFRISKSWGMIVRLLAVAVILEGVTLIYLHSKIPTRRVRKTTTAAAQTNPTAPGREAPVPIEPEPDDSSIWKKLVAHFSTNPEPEPEAIASNPNVRVWVDLRTGLYYCPDSDIYGKTAKGKYSSQRDAVLEHFEPAYRRSCD